MTAKENEKQFSKHKHKAQLTEEELKESLKVLLKQIKKGTAGSIIFC